jgi:hypothetical protein
MSCTQCGSEGHTRETCGVKDPYSGYGNDSQKYLQSLQLKEPSIHSVFQITVCLQKGVKHIDRLWQLSTKQYNAFVKKGRRDNFTQLDGQLREIEY